MALEATFTRLCVHIERLGEAVSDLQVQVREDSPRHSKPSLIDILEDRSEIVIGWLSEAHAKAQESQRHVGHPTDLNQARRLLTDAHRRIHEAVRLFDRDLVSYERVIEVRRAAFERDEAWKQWSASYRTSLSRCWEPIYTVEDTLLACWQEIAERAGMNSVAVQATSIGQQINNANEEDAYEYQAVC